PRIESLARDGARADADGDPRRAIQAWGQLLARAPGSLRAMARLAQSHLAAGDRDAARGVLEQVLVAHPGHAMAHALLARIHVADGAPERALEALDAAIRNEPRAWGALLEKARVLESLGRRREAALCWSTGLGAMPPDAMQAPTLRGTVEAARTAIAANQRELRDFLEARTDDLRAQERRRDVERYE